MTHKLNTRSPLASPLRRATVTLLGAAALTLGSTAVHAQMEIKLGHVGGPGSLLEQSANEFARVANERLGNKAKVVVFGSSQLGGDSEMMQKLRLGTLELSIPTTIMSSHVPAFGMFEMPYLVKNRDHMKKIETEVLRPTMLPLAEKRASKFWASGKTAFGTSPTTANPSSSPKT